MSFKLKNPRKGTETYNKTCNKFLDCFFQIKESPEGDWNDFLIGLINVYDSFQIKESPEGDWNIRDEALGINSGNDFQIKESPEGDWNAVLIERSEEYKSSFKLKNPRKGTETIQ